MSTLVAIGAALLVTLVIPAFALPASAAPAPAAGGAPQQWAYGAEKWSNVTVTMPNGTYTSHAFFGWQVIFTATNTSASTVMLEAQRTMGAYLYAQFCSPSCASPTLFGNLSMVAHTAEAGFANLTYTATVYEHGNATSAVGLANASSQGNGNLNESFLLRYSNANATHTIHDSLVVSGHSQASVDFAPALGLTPWNVTPGTSWNSSSAFTAQGSWAITWAAQRMGYFGGSMNYSGNPSGSVSANGTVALAGHDWGNVTLKNGLTVPAVTLVLTGPFDDHDGVILVPHDFDMFGGAHEAYDGEALGMQSASTSQVDFALDALHHRVRLAAAATDFASTDSSMGGMGIAPTGAQPAATSAATGPTTLQAQPESVAQAQQASRCLGGACTTSTSSTVFSGFVVIALVALAVIALVGTISAVEYRAWLARRAQERAPPAPVPGVLSPPAPPAPPAAPGQPPRQG